MKVLIHTMIILLTNVSPKNKKESMGTIIFNGLAFIIDTLIFLIDLFI